MEGLGFLGLGLKVLAFGYDSAASGFVIKLLSESSGFKLLQGFRMGTCVTTPKTPFVLFKPYNSPKPH